MCGGRKKKMLKLVMEREEKIKFWIQASDSNLETMEIIFAGKKYSDALFFGHLAIETMLKAAYVSKGLEPVPKIHDLVKLAILSGLEIDKERRDELEIVTGFNINARYDSYKREFYERATRQYAIRYIRFIKFFIKWLKKQI